MHVSECVCHGGMEWSRCASVLLREEMTSKWSLGVKLCCVKRKTHAGPVFLRAGVFLLLIAEPHL